MGRYILERLLMTIVVVIVAAIVIFTIISFVPGDPAQMLLPSDATQEDIYAMRVQLGLEDPFFVQLFNFLKNAFLKFDFGVSWVKGSPVVDGLLERLPYTFGIGIATIIISTAIAIPLGVTAAVHQNGLADRACMVFGMICISIPNFWFALLIIMLFSLELNLLPAFGVGSFKHYIMPIIAGSLHGIGSVARQTRSSMLEVIRSDYIVTARAKGLKEKAVIYKHMLPNALIPVITVVGGSLSRTIGGMTIIEQIFSIPGVGTYLTSGITTRDYPIIRGCVIILAAFTSIMMLLVDLAYAMVDPRIKAQFSGRSKRRK